ncbi:hypothetical protein SS1G_05130 [Sclerotinia sclerotiorum 1980 UF-70]|nr:hypothetical protein SS1G_05130 [Sclerotinia sclerotiorum 1980 UF-70]EDO02653.1 hypothetical protein SS1G_05130 [Sclerotinia sclerotiorum 1980 UF-70]
MEELLVENPQDRGDAKKIDTRLDDIVKKAKDETV